MKLLNGVVASCAIVLSMGVAMAASANAQMNRALQAPSRSSNSGLVRPQTVNDATLKSAAAVYIKVQNITRRARRKAEKTTSANDQRNIMKQAEAQKVAAVEHAGMNVQQYDRVIRMVHTDEELHSKFLTYVAQDERGTEL